MRLLKSTSLSSRKSRVRLIPLTHLLFPQNELLALCTHPLYFSMPMPWSALQVLPVLSLHMPKCHRPLEGGLRWGAASPSSQLEEMSCFSEIPSTESTPLLQPLVFYFVPRLFFGLGQDGKLPMGQCPGA